MSSANPPVRSPGGRVVRSRKSGHSLEESATPFSPEGGLGSRISAVAARYPDRKSAASAAGVSTDQLARYMRDENQPTLVSMAGLAAGAGVRLDWLATGRGSMLTAVDQPQSGEAALRLCRIPVYELRLAAGAGAPAWAAEEPKEWLDVPVEFLTGYLRVDPRQAVAFPVVGESMEPAIRDGELAIMDRSDTTIERDGSVYVLRRHDDLFVKRVFKRAGRSYLLRSDNPTFGEETVPASEFDEITVLGRIGGSLRRV